MRVDYFCSYYSRWLHENVAPRTQPLWDAYMFSRAVKHRAINGYCTIPWEPSPKRIDATNIGEARSIFGMFIEWVYEQQGYGEAAIVPAPSKDSFSVDRFRSLVMVEEALSGTFWRPTIPALRFNQQVAPAAHGGPRGYTATLPLLTVQAGQARPIVLVDDILTTGGTLLAARQKLIEAGYTVLGAITCSRTATTAEDAFRDRSLELTNNVGAINF